MLINQPETMWRKGTVLLVLFFSFTFLPAAIRLQSAQYMPVDDRYDSLADRSVSRLLSSYRGQLEKQMSRVIGYCPEPMKAEKPESPLSNFLADELLAAAIQETGRRVDIAVINFGGIRASLQSGPVTVGEVYRVMPFENKLVLAEMNGKEVLELFQSIARAGGEGIAGACLVIKDKKVTDVQIAGRPIQEDSTYLIATLDFLAEGNSSLKAFLKSTAIYSTNMKVRDAIIVEIEKLTAAGKPIKASCDGRITVLP
jgi:2',3'-cyclic-nucleotide 2'-phosphodiesterase (5'-nucleotidase family)